MDTNNSTTAIVTKKKIVKKNKGIQPSIVSNEIINNNNNTLENITNNTLENITNNSNTTIVTKKKIVKNNKGIQPSIVSNEIINNNTLENITQESLPTDTTQPTQPTKTTRNTKQIKKSNDISYLSLPTDNIIDFYDSRDKEQYEINKNNKVNNIKSAISQIHQKLWDTQQLKPDITLEEVMNLMFLKYLGVFASDTNDNGKIDLLNKQYYKDHISDIELEICFKYIKNFSLMYSEMKTYKKNGNSEKLEEYRSNANENSDYIKHITKILKRHPITGKIFTETTIDILKIKTPETLLEILEILEYECFSNNNDIEDLIGEIYEYFINDYMKSKSALGQYFTPRTLMDITLKLKEKDIIDSIEYFKQHDELFNTNNELHICDKTMGTGGWLVKFYNQFKSHHNNIILQGYEVDPKTYNYSIINMLTTTGKYSRDSRCDSSLTVIPDAKIHFGTSNPPFSAGLTYATLKKEYNANKVRFIKNVADKKLEYKNYNNTKFEDIYFLTNENSTPLQVLQLYIHQLTEGGLCFIVIPYGELFNKDGKDIINTRKQLLDKINITDIIVCPGGLFTYTDTKVCMLIFKKDKHGTKEIRFGRYEFNTQDHNSKKRYLKFYRHYRTVSKADICKEPIYSLYHMDYLHDGYINKLQLKMQTKECEWVEFGDVFELIKGELQSSKVEEDLTGDVKLVLHTLSENDWRTIKTSTYYLGGLFIPYMHAPNRQLPITYCDYNVKCVNTDLMYRASPHAKFTNKINLKYIQYLLQSLSNYIKENYYKGACNLTLDVKNFNRMKIPIPSLDVQYSYVKCISDANNKRNELSNFNPNLQNLSYVKTLASTIQTTEITELFNLAIEKQIKLPSIKWVEFGDVFELIKGELQSSKVEEDLTGDGVFINLSKTQKFITINNTLLTGENVFLSIVSPIGLIQYYNGNCNYSNLLSLLKTKPVYENKINKKYIYNYLKSIQTHIEKTYEKGACNKSLDVKNFNRMKIPLPPIESQNEIILEINEVEEIANRWDRDIEYLKNKKGTRMLDIINLTIETEKKL